MEKFFKVLMQIEGLSLSFVCLAYLLVLRFENPDMTSIRWLIEFWQDWMVLMSCAVVGFYIYGVGKIWK